MAAGKGFGVRKRFKSHNSFTKLKNMKEKKKRRRMKFCHLRQHGWEIDGETVETVSHFIFLGSKSLQMVTAAVKLKDAYSLEGKL